MPPNRKNSAPPPVMTWMKASPVLAVCFVFDAVRFVFEQFWFFGPALAAVYCTANVGGVVSTWSAGLLGTKTAAAVCGASATVVGSLGAPAIAAFGVVMAIAVGLFGWMTAGLMLMMTNARIFKENEGHALWFGFSLLISEVPIIGSLPALTGVTVKMYSTQIKKDKENLKKYKKEQTDDQLQEQNQQTAQLMQANTEQQIQTEQQEQVMQQEEQDVENEEQYAEAENEEISASEEIVSAPMVPEYGYSKTPPPLPVEHRATPPPIPEGYRDPVPSPIPSIPPPLPEWARVVPPPLPAEYRTTPPPIPQEYRMTPPPLPLSTNVPMTSVLPPPLPIGVPNYSGATQPPPIPITPLPIPSIPPPLPNMPPPLPEEYLRTVPPPLPKQEKPWSSAGTVPPPLPGQTWWNPNMGVPPPIPTETKPSSKAVEEAEDLILAAEEEEKMKNEKLASEKELLNARSEFQELDPGFFKFSMGEENYEKYVEEQKNLPPDATVHLYHGLNSGGYKDALEILNAPSHGIEQRSGPTVSLVPVGQFWKGVGFRYAFRRDQIEFPGENNPGAVIRMQKNALGDEGDGIIINESGSLPLDQFDAEIMRSKFANPDPDVEKEIAEKLRYFSEKRNSGGGA